MSRKQTRAFTALAAIVLFTVGTACMPGLFRLSAVNSPVQSTVLWLLFCIPFAGVAVYIAARMPLFGNMWLFLAALIVAAAALLLRIACLDLPYGEALPPGMARFTQDYNAFLRNWVEQMRALPVDQALSRDIGDYNVPYLYILVAISRVSLPDVYLIKWVSVLFDMALALAVAETALLFVRKRWVALPIFVIALFYPTLWLNSAYWAQCDATYALFVVLAFYFGCKNRPVLSVAMAAVAFAFKLQTVFFLPAYMALLLAKRLKIWHLFVFPAVFAATVMPAVLAGRPLINTFAIYFKQTSTYAGYLHLNVSSPYVWLYPDNYGTAAPPWMRYAALGLTALFVLGVWAALWARRGRLTNHDFLSAALLMTLGVVWLLPHMHDRYYYLADILVMIYVAHAGQKVFRWLALPLVLAGSFAGYNNYFRYYWQKQWVTTSVGALAVLLAILLVSLLWLYGGKRKRA